MNGKRSSGSRPAYRKEECELERCPEESNLRFMREVIENLQDDHEDIMKRLAIIDGNSHDREGGKVGRIVSDVKQLTSEFKDLTREQNERLSKIFWIAVSILATLVGSLLYKVAAPHL